MFKLIDMFQGILFLFLGKVWADISIALGGDGWSQELLVQWVRFLFTITGVCCRMVPILWMVAVHRWGAILVLADHMLDAAEAGPGVLVDGRPHAGDGWLLLAGSLLHDRHRHLCPWLLALCPQSCGNQ